MTRLPDIPDLAALDTQQMSLAELGSLHRRLGDWLDAAEAAADREAPDEATVAAVRVALVALTRERRERQSDESRGR